MALSLAQKLRITEGTTQRTLDAPADFADRFGPLPPGVKFSGTSSSFDQIHWFVTNRQAMEKGLDKVMGLLKEGIVCWIYYPKGSSGRQTDLTRDKGWDRLTDKSGLQWLSLISFDDDWSAFGFRLSTASDQKKPVKADRAVFDYVDPKTKMVNLPSDFEPLLSKSKKAKAFFEGLSFSNKKEYIEWIVSAKRDETRRQRLSDSIDRLEKGWKNPANR
jgi:hypothetical protein